MKIKVSGLEGPLLAEFVARVWGWSKWCEQKENTTICWWRKSNGSLITTNNYRPDTNGGQAMELAKEFNLLVDFRSNKVNYFLKNDWMSGDTVEIAICRAVVASKFGEYVEVEE